MVIDRGLRIASMPMSPTSATSAGLSTEEVDRRLEEDGANELASADGISPWEVLGNQFKNLLIF